MKAAAEDRVGQVVLKVGDHQGEAKAGSGLRSYFQTMHFHQQEVRKHLKSVAMAHVCNA